MNAYLSPETVALQLAVSSRTIRRLVACGDLPGIRVGGQVRIAQDDLNAYLARQAVASGPAA